jgi:hypothetical protein
MLDWIAEGILTICSSAVRGRGSPSFMLIRAMFALILIALIVCAMARPFCSTIVRYVNKAMVRN